MSSSDAPKASLCIFKQYTSDAVKPTSLAGAETLQITLTASLSFIVALSWNEVFKSTFEHLVEKFWKKSLYRLMYAITVTSFLFFFNIAVSKCVTEMRKRAQLQVAMTKNNEKKTDTA